MRKLLRVAWLVFSGLWLMACLGGCAITSDPDDRNYLLRSSDDKSGCRADALGGCPVPPGEESNASTTQSIVGGVEAREDAWPSMVALLRQSDGIQVCGGTLIADRWVLTAAHCVGAGENGDLETAIIGRHALSNPIGEWIKIDGAYRHPNYDAETNDNDIALLHLASVSLSPKVEIVNIDHASRFIEGGNVIVIGWGRLHEGDDEPASDVLREVVVPLVSHAQCKMWYAARGSRLTITNNQFCAGIAGKDSCQGDSGGPIFMIVDKKRIQIGIVSAGDGCAKAEAPGVYTHLLNYRTWLYNTSGWSG